jgi:hypothetical protein
MVEDLNLLHEWGSSDDDGGAGLKVSHKHPKTEYDNNYHETSDGPDATLKDYPTKEQAVAAFERGLVRARAEAVKLGMSLEGHEELMSKPWLGEHILVTDMADEADDDDALVGARVLIQSHSNTKLNGLKGVVIGFDAEKQLFFVRLEDGQVMTFHRRYLQVIDDDVDAGDGGGSGNSGSGDAGESGDEIALGDDVRELTDRLLAAAATDCDEHDGGDIQQAPEDKDPCVNDSPDTDVSPGAEVSPDSVTDGTANDGTHQRVFSSTLLWDGERRHKVTMVNACKQVNIGPRISSNRLDRVKQAQKQLQANKSAALAPMGTLDSAAAASGGVTEIQAKEAVIENGSDLAFAMDEGGKLTLWIGRVEIMSGRKKIPLSTAIFLEDAKIDDVHFVCTWFEEREDGTLVLGSVRDLTRYSAKSCLSTVDLKLVDSSRERGNIYVFADPTCRDNLLVALETLATPVGNQETLAEAEVRRQFLEDARAKADSDAAQVERAPVQRDPGKRKATAVVNRH